MLLLTLLAAAPALIPDGTRLREGETCYSIRNGEQVIGHTFQSVRRGADDTLAIVVHQRLANGKFDLRDEFLVRRSDLRPIALDNFRDGKPHVHLDYGAARITGWKIEKGERKPVSVGIRAPVWDGNLWGLTFAALPLSQGSSFELPMYQYDSGLGAFSGTVTGEEIVATPDGQVKAWVVDAGTAKDRRTTYLIGKDAAELGYHAGPMKQSLGGDCSAFTARRGERG